MCEKKRMPFGVFRGWFFEELPDNYIQWALDADVPNQWKLWRLLIVAKQRGIHKQSTSALHAKALLSKGSSKRSAIVID